MKEAEAIQTLVAFVERASPDDIARLIETLCAERPQLRAPLLEALSRLRQEPPA